MKRLRKAIQKDDKDGFTVAYAVSRLIDEDITNIPTKKSLGQYLSRSDYFQLKEKATSTTPSNVWCISNETNSEKA